ncbi:response regulator transcription factor [Marinobacterium aestuariivivens]|uniref:Response regulator transcription factor n=1 Tax=Marinobacterium aestuariivivens TaxID=1698799 RepID=A0ABW1ZUY5_9GAMM
MKVLVADDDADILAGIADFLEWRGIATDCASNGDQVLELCRQNRYDVLILDVMMPRLDGLSCCERLRADGFTTPILFLTALDTLEDKIRGFQAGADDYLIKPFAMAELVCRVEALSLRISRQQLRKLTFGPLQLDVEQGTATRDGVPLALTPLTFKLLRHLVARAPRMISREELEHQIWGSDPPSSDALRSHLYQLRMQLDRPFRQPMLETRRGVGFRLTDPTAREPHETES